MISWMQLFDRQPQRLSANAHFPSFLYLLQIDIPVTLHLVSKYPSHPSLIYHLRYIIHMVYLFSDHDPVAFPSHFSNDNKTPEGLFSCCLCSFFGHFSPSNIAPKLYSLIYSYAQYFIIRHKIDFNVQRLGQNEMAHKSHLVRTLSWVLSNGWTLHHV